MLPKKLTLEQQIMLCTVQSKIENIPTISEIVTNTPEKRIVQKLIYVKGSWVFEFKVNKNVYELITPYDTQGLITFISTTNSKAKKYDVYDLITYGQDGIPSILLHKYDALIENKDQKIIKPFEPHSLQQYSKAEPSSKKQKTKDSAPRTNTTLSFSEQTLFALFKGQISQMPVKKVERDAEEKSPLDSFIGTITNQSNNITSSLNESSEFTAIHTNIEDLPADLFTWQDHSEIIEQWLEETEKEQNNINNETSQNESPEKPVNPSNLVFYPLTLACFEFKLGNMPDIIKFGNVNDFELLENGDYKLKLKEGESATQKMLSIRAYFSSIRITCDFFTRDDENNAIIKKIAYEEFMNELNNDLTKIQVFGTSVRFHFKTLKSFNQNQPKIYCHTYRSQSDWMAPQPVQPENDSQISADIDPNVATSNNM